MTSERMQESLRELVADFKVREREMLPGLQGRECTTTPIACLSWTCCQHFKLRDSTTTLPPFIVVGNKHKDTENVSEISSAGRALAESLGAACHMEASALSGAGVDELFQAIVSVVLAHRRHNHNAAALRTAFQPPPKQ